MNKLCWLISLAGLFVFASCSSDNIPQPGNEDIDVPSTQKAIITVGMPDKDTPNSKVSFDDSKLSLAWETGDQIKLVGFDASHKYIGEHIFNLKEMVANTNNKAAKFEGNWVEGATQYDVYYQTEQLSFETDTDAYTRQPVFNYDGQIQTADNSTAHLKKYLFLKTDKIIQKTDLTSGQFILQMQNAIMRFDLITLPEQNDWGTANQLYWITNYNYSDTERALLLTLKFNPQKGSTAYFSFEPNAMNLSGYVAVRLVGDAKIYTAVANKAVDNVCYNPGTRYHIGITNQATNPDRYFTWNELVQRNNEIWMKAGKTEGFPSEYKVLKVHGTDYWRLWHNDYDMKSIPDLGVALQGTAAEVTEVILPATLKSLRKEAFIQNTYLTTVIFRSSNTLQWIDAKAFQGCTNLTNIELPTSITNIDQHAFEGCSSLTNINLPMFSLTTIDDNAFTDCTSLTSITVPKTLTSVGAYAFKGCTSLEFFDMEIPFPALNKIGAEAFSGTKIKKIILPFLGQPSDINELALVGMKFLTELWVYAELIHNIVPAGVETEKIDLYLGPTYYSIDVNSNTWEGRIFKSIIPVNEVGNIAPNAGLPNIDKENGF